MPTLGYWKIRGLAQPIRLLLKYVGEDFEDKYYEQGDAPEYSRAAWTDVKHTVGLDFPNLPYYFDGDIKITQSNAILRHIGRKYNLLGETDAEKATMDMMLDIAMDFRNQVVRMAYNPEYKKLLEDYKPRLKETLKSYDDWLKKNKWFAGEKITVVDFPMYELLDQYRMMIEGILKDYENLTAFMDAFESQPKIKAYMASDTFMKGPVNNKVAQFR